MQRKRSLFLLEVVIAIALVGFFSVYFLHSSLQHLHKERQALLDLEFAWQSDLHKMKLLEQGWPQAALLKEKKWIEEPHTVTMNERKYSKVIAHRLYCSQENEKGYLLSLEEGKKTYHFFVKK